MLLFMDGQAHYDTSRIAMKYSSLSTAGVTWSVVAEGRFGNCLKRVANAGGASLGYLGVSPLTTRLGPWTPTVSGVCGFAIKVDDLSRVGTQTVITGADRGLVAIFEGATLHSALHLNPDGTFSLVRNEDGGGGALKVIAQSSEGLTSGTWLFVECKWVIHATAGSFQVRVNGVPVLDFAGRTGENVTAVTLGVWNALRVGSVAALGAPVLTMRFCDLYLADLATTLADDVHDFLGDGTILTILPNAPGDAAGWSPSTGTNWDAVNDRPAPDDDSTYVATSTPGVLDLYHFEDIPAGSLVKGAHLCILARKETEGAATVAPLVQPPGSGPLTGPAQGVANILYDRYITQPYDLNPASGVNFTAADINNGQFGVVKTV